MLKELVIGSKLVNAYIHERRNKMQVLNFHEGNAHIYWNSFSRAIRLTRKGKAVIEIVTDYNPTITVTRYVSSGKFESIQQINEIIDAEYDRQWHGDDQE